MKPIGGVVAFFRRNSAGPIRDESTFDIATSQMEQWILISIKGPRLLGRKIRAVFVRGLHNMRNDEVVRAICSPELEPKSLQVGAWFYIGAQKVSQGRRG